jgi:RNA polymerase sigma factor (TIGR02999 family)
MDSNLPNDFTKLLLTLESDKPMKRSATDRIFEIVYGELRRLASDLMRRERPDHTLQPTALVHEAYCRLVDQTRIEWQNRAHFFGIAARAMRQILVNYAYQHTAAKRGGNLQRVTLNDNIEMGITPEIEILELDEALKKLAEIENRMAQVVELHIFGGMGFEEIAHILNVSRRTVFKDWRVAKMWLKRLLTEGVT